MSGERKWLLVCALTALGGGVGFLSPAFCVAWPLSALASCVALLYAYGGRRVFYFVAVAFFALSVSWHAVSGRLAVIVASAELNRARPTAADFTIPSFVKVYSQEGGSHKVSFAGKMKGVPVFVNVYLEAGVRPPSPGETWRCCGWLGRASGAWYSRRTFWVRGRGSYAVKISDGAGSSPARVFNRARLALSRRACIGVDADGEVSRLNRALLLGERSSVDPQTKKAFADSGTAHLFAISGLHVLVIAKFLSILLALAALPVKIRPVFLVLLLWGYVLLTGASASAVRAGAMASTAALAPLFSRRADSLVSWAQTFSAVHLINPWSLVDTGSQLSFIVMLGLVIWQRMKAFKKAGAVHCFAPTVIAWVFGFPIVSAAFGVITPGGIFANMLAIPIASLSVVFSAVGVACSFVSAMAAAFFNAAASMTTSLMLGVARSVAAVPWSHFEITPWSLWECLCAYAFVAAVLAALERWSRRCVI